VAMERPMDLYYNKTYSTIPLRMTQFE